MIVALFPIPDDDLGPLGPYIRPFIPDDDTEEGCERDAGDFDEDEYGPWYDKLAA